MIKYRYRMFYIRYQSMPISNKPTISHVLGFFNIEALCFDIEGASILNESGGPGSCRAADHDCRLQFCYVGPGL